MDDKDFKPLYDAITARIRAPLEKELLRITDAAISADIMMMQDLIPLLARNLCNLTTFLVKYGEAHAHCPPEVRSSQLDTLLNGITETYILQMKELDDPTSIRHAIFQRMLERQPVSKVPQK